MASARAADHPLTGDVLVKARGRGLPRRTPLSTSPTFAELLERLSRGRLRGDVAADILLIDAERVSLTIDIDRDTGLVRHWRMSTHGRAAAGRPEIAAANRHGTS